MTLALLGLCSSEDNAVDVAARLGGRAWVAHETQKPGGPYRAAFEVVTDDIEAATGAADVSLHVRFLRVIKPATEPASPDRVIAAFGMVRHPELSHRESDDHWRDVHGPVALRCHLAMSDYEQLSVVATLHGPPIDGLAMCAFPSREILSERFFNDEQAKADVTADVARFADTRRSLPRVVLQQAV